MRRGSRDRDSLIVASLNGTALRLTDDKAARDAAIAEVREIATVDNVLRVDLLTQAAGSLLASHLRDPGNQRPRHAALLLVHVGADSDQVIAHAQVVLERLRDGYRGGIGNPRG